MLTLWILASSHPNSIFKELNELVNKKLEDILSLLRVGRLRPWVYTDDKKITR